MSDTQRSLATLQTLLADNTSKAISPQDLRDAIVSALGGYAGIYCAAGVTPQTINIAAAKLTGFTADMVASGATPGYATSRIVVGVAGDWLVEFHASLLGTAAQTFAFQAYNGTTPIAGAKCTRTIASGTDVTQVSFAAIATLAASDVITVYASSLADAQSITVSEMSIVVKRLG